MKKYNYVEMTENEAINALYLIPASELTDVLNATDLFCTPPILKEKMTDILVRAITDLHNHIQELKDVDIYQIGECIFEQVFGLYPFNNVELWTLLYWYSNPTEANLYEAKEEFCKDIDMLYRNVLYTYFNVDIR